MEGAVKAIGMIKEDTVDVGHLESIMREMGIHLTPEEIQKALTHVTREGEISNILLFFAEAWAFPLLGEMLFVHL